MSEPVKVGMTVSEAAGKWCPHARVLHHIYEQQYTWTQIPAVSGAPYGSYVPAPNGNQTPKSSASYNREGTGYIPYGCYCLADACAAWRWVTSIEQGEPRGYCGAFGPPEC